MRTWYVLLCYPIPIILVIVFLTSLIGYMLADRTLFESTHPRCYKYDVKNIGQCVSHCGCGVCNETFIYGKNKHVFLQHCVSRDDEISKCNNIQWLGYGYGR